MVAGDRNVFARGRGFGVDGRGGAVMTGVALWYAVFGLVAVYVTWRRAVRRGR